MYFYIFQNYSFFQFLHCLYTCSVRIFVYLRLDYDHFELWRFLERSAYSGLSVNDTVFIRGPHLLEKIRYCYRNELIMTLLSLTSSLILLKH